MRFRNVSSKAFVRNLYVSCLYKELGCFLFGCCICQSLTNMAKLSVGRLRPHFLSVCGVTYASLNCTPGTYVASVTCLSSNPHLVEEARCVCVCAHLYICWYPSRIVKSKNLLTGKKVPVLDRQPRKLVTFVNMNVGIF